MRMAGYFIPLRRFVPQALVAAMLALLVMGAPAAAAPMITLSPSSGAIGTSILITGSNFDSYRGDSLSVYFDDDEIPGSPLTVPDSGVFTVDFTIPDDTDVGRHWITVTIETDTVTTLAREFFIVSEAKVDLDIDDGYVGTEVTISGDGFYSGRTVTIYYYNVIGEKVGTAAVSSTGEFSYTFIVPNSTAGEHRITVKNAEGNFAETTFEVLPLITLNLSSAGPGDLVTVSGTGFGKRIDVEITFGVYKVASARTNDYGDFPEVKFNVPEVAPATYDVKAADKNGNLDKTRFTTTAGASLDLSSGHIGSRLTVHGSGFLVGETVTVTYDNLRVAMAVPDNNGAFDATFTVPPSKSGSHVITVTDGTTTKQFAFTVESDAPLAPGLLLPANNSDSRSMVYMDWQDVDDPSQPVEYSVQVSADQNFSTVVADIDGLTISEYTLTEEERLTASGQPAKFFWRIKAADSAGNESEWSETWSFTVNAPATPELLLPASGEYADKLVFFNWQTIVSLDSPVTYLLQVASDLGFTTLLIEKPDVADSEYQLSLEGKDEFKKREAPYYWRVKAVDGAMNESDWSPTGSFYIGSEKSFPLWATITLIVLGVIIVIFLAFRFGRRTAYKPPE